MPQSIGNWEVPHPDHVFSVGGGAFSPWYIQIM
jgi:hypothetical protein